MRTFLLVALLATGCVSKKKYTELENMYATEQSETARLQGQVRGLEGTVAQLTATNEKLTADVHKRDALAKSRVDDFKQVLAEFQPLIDRGLLEVTARDGRVVVGLATDILFPSASAQLSTDGKKTVTEVAGLLARRTTGVFQVEGHTDNQPIKSKTYANNWALGSARALTVVEAMIAGGMPPERISAASFGQFHPIADNQTEDGREQNRRIEIVLLPDLGDLPGSDELKKLSTGKPVAKKKKPADASKKKDEAGKKKADAGKKKADAGKKPKGAKNPKGGKPKPKAK